MSANAASLRRILRSIGTHATPTTNTLRPSSQRTSSGPRHSSTVAAPARTRNNEAEPTTTKSSTGDTPFKPTVNEGKEAKPTVTNRSEADPIVKEGLAFRKQYFDAHKSDDKHRMKQRARRRLLSKRRSEISERQAWQDVLRILRQHSPADAEHYVKRMETIRLPEGIFAQWRRDPGESILEVMQRTGSHVQVKPTKEIGHFSSITLLGTPSQNAAAKKLLQESDLLSAISEDDLNASKSLADYHLRSEIRAPVERKTKPVNDANTSAELVDDELDDFDISDLQDAVSVTTAQDQTRAVWSKPSTTTIRGESFKVKGPKGHMVIGTTKSTTPASAIALTTRIYQLTANRPRKMWSMDRQPKIPDIEGLPIKDELVSLITNPDHAHLITPMAARTALRYLAKHMHFPAVREILNALKDSNRQVDAEILNADLFNILLAAAARNENVVAFHYIVNTMRERSVSPNAGTWVAFHTLMLKRYPGDSAYILSEMRHKSVLADPSVAVENLEAYSAKLLYEYMRKRPKASIKDFVESMNKGAKGVKWLTAFSANNMCHTLLKRGRMTMAFEVVDELVRNGGRPDAVTLNTFLTAAMKDGHLPLAIAILRKFHHLDTKSLSLASSAKEPATVLPRKHDLSITLNDRTFKILFNLAWDHRYMNSTRVFWRYACCAGHVDYTIAQSMKTSAASQGAEEGFVQTEDIQVSPRAAMWSAWAAKFAMGVQAGLGPAQAAKVLSVVGRPSVGNNLKDSLPTPSEQLTLNRVRNKAKLARLALITTDQNEVQSLKPLRSLAEIAEAAWRLDRKWKDKDFGLPKGLTKYGEGDTMFEMMLKEGIEVPVEVGDGVGLTL